VNCEARESALGQKYAQPFAESERKKIGLQNFILPELRSANFRIADRTLACDFKNAFQIAEKYHAEALCAEATSFNFAECKTWRCFLDEVRTSIKKRPPSLRRSLGEGELRSSYAKLRRDEVRL